jgi:hypothetical protein
VTKSYRRNLDPHPDWSEYICIERNPFVQVGDQFYKVSPDGFLMPTTPTQEPPDLRYFSQPKK